jgi:Ala-tRNA(Pro) deacylase
MTGDPIADVEPVLGSDAYELLIGMLEQARARFRLIDHAPEGRTELVSAMRGNKVSQAAKCLVVMVKIGKKQKRYVLAVVPGDTRLNLNAVKDLTGGTYVAFADAAKAEALAGAASGTILPFSFNPDLELIVDPALFESPELFFNAARLDRSLALDTDDYKRLANARVETIT